MADGRLAPGGARLSFSRDALLGGAGARIQFSISYVVIIFASFAN